MKFLCGGCRTKYQISDEKIRSKILTIRCKKCGSKILVRETLLREGGTAVAPIAEEDRAGSSVPVAAGAEMDLALESGIGASKSARPAAGVAAEARSSAPHSAPLASAFHHAMHAPPPDSETDDMPTCIAPTPQNLDAAGVEWYVAVDGEQSGPFAFAEIVRRVQSKEIVGRHYVWHDGMDGWKRVRDVPDLVSYIAEKKRPPPLPGGEPQEAKGGADVVDFASKRKEREQRKSAEAPPSEPAREAGDARADSAEGKGQDKAAAERDEQLDSVLNEALGIQGEGRTQKTAAGPVSVLGVAGLPGAAPAADDLAGFDKDDIFANVPRATPSDLVRESTRFFVAAAGVNRQRKRNRMGVMVGAFAVLAFAMFLGAWAVGAIAISIPGIGNPFQRSETGEEEMIVELDPDDPEQLRKILDDAARARRAGKPAPKRVRVAKTTAAPAGPDGEYITDTADDPTAAGSRGDLDKPEGIEIDPLGATPGSGEVVQAQLPESGVDSFPAVERATLSQDTIGKVINEKKKSVSICYQQSLRGNEDLRGKLEFLVTIEPSGVVSRASVETTAFKGTKLARCIQTKIKDWRFPPFTGEPQQVQVPFVLEKNSY